MIGARNEGRRWVALTFSRELKGDDSVALFERGWLTIGCLNVNVDGVVVWGVDMGLCIEKTHPPTFHSDDVTKRWDFESKRPTPRVF